MTTPNLPLCQEGAEPDRFKLFAKLRELWKSKDGTKLINGKEDPYSYASLGRWLDVPKQSISQWATGTGDKSPPPWHIVMRLATELGLGVALEGEGAKLYPLADRS